MDKFEQIPTLLRHVERYAGAWFESLATRPVRAMATAGELRQMLGGDLPDEGVDPHEAIKGLTDAGSSGTMASAGPRYFGFVVGGSLPAAVAADWLVSLWDQNGGIYALSPLTAVIEQITASWLTQLAGLPSTMSVGFVTGCQMANFTGLAAARHRVLRDAGWDVEGDGLFGAPPINVIVGEEAHYTIAMALRHLGLGANRIQAIPSDAQGRMRPDRLAAALRASTGPAIVCAQAGNVNTGAIDPLADISELAKTHGAWLHVDGAFGLWAAASPQRAAQLTGIARADSVATDAHKWLNVPYDCGIIFCADEAAHRRAMSMMAAYIIATGDERDPHEFVPEESRRARAVPVYAALRSLGRTGIADLVERNCRQATRFAEGLRTAGYEVLNDVTLNQVLVSFGSDDQTQRTIAAIQRDGTCWCGGTVWKGRRAMRISVSNWSTTDEDVERSLDAMLRAARTGAAHVATNS
jgi:glutamate/tyrosine decarboxylase-like PLP-dependent enzyme